MLYKLENKISGTEELKSAQTLNKKAHDLFLQLFSNCDNYMYKVSNDGTHFVYHLAHESSPRMFLSIHDICSCIDWVSNQKQGVHEYVLTRKKFPSYWSNIYHHRECLTSSQHILDNTIILCLLLTMKKINVSLLQKVLEFASTLNAQFF